MGIEDTHTRGFNPLLREANSITKEFHLYEPGFRADEVKRVQSYAEAYKRDTSAKVIALRSKEDNSVIALDYVSRLDDTYRQQTRRKIEDLVDRMPDREGHFITLTIDPKQYMSLYETGKAGNAALNRVMSALRAAHPNLAYVCIREYQEASANIHFHIAVTGIPGSSNELRKWLVSEWREGFVWVENCYKGSRNGLGYYMSKELSKSLRKGEYGQPGVTIALLWATRQRYLSFTRSLLETNSKEILDAYEYLGVFSTAKYGISPGRYDSNEWDYQIGMGKAS